MRDNERTFSFTYFADIYDETGTSTRTILIAILTQNHFKVYGI